MKIGLKIFTLLLTLCPCTKAAYAQAYRQSISAYWGVTIPMNEGYIEKVGFVNPSLEWSYRVFSIFSAGVSFGYSYREDKGVSDERMDGYFSSGYRKRSLATLPLLAKLNYFPLGYKSTLLSPYIGVVAGIQYAKFHIVGETINSNQTTSWAETFSAEIGTRIQPAKNNKLYFDLRCLWNYGGNIWSLFETRSIQTLGFTIGAGLKF